MTAITSCDPINPYTSSETFGVPYNGGYKPDPTLEWIPADTNVIDSSDDFVRPASLPPSNIYLKTCEARRVDPRVGGIPTFQMEYDDFTESQPIKQVDPPPSASPDKVVNDYSMQWKIMILLAVVIFILLVSNRF
jgi:hypothetical protein